MKKIINLILICLACLVLVWGVVASVLTLSSETTKNYKAYLAKDGREIVSTDVNGDETHLKVKKTEIELISYPENLKRLAKNAKIILNEAKKEYAKDDSNINRIAYENALVNYEQRKAASKKENTSLFVDSAGVFFGTYFPITVLLGIALLINQKIEYKKCNKE